MNVTTESVRTLDDASRLGDLVYTTYGLTYHRSFMYTPDVLLELNRSGKIRSVIAKNERGDIIGHMATIRPWFESIPSDIAERAPTSVELGLSIVHPDYRGQQLQYHLGMACLVNERQSNPSLRNLFGKCLTIHTHSQKGGRNMLGRACALLLGSIPAWVTHDLGERASPMTTIVLQYPCTTNERRLFVPAPSAELINTLVDSNVLRRRVIAVAPGEARLPAGTSRCSHWFEPSRRRGVIHVWRVGSDIVSALLKLVRWMTEGHMEHITVLLPANDPVIASLMPEFESAGLFFGGFIPELEGRDVLVMEYLSWDQLDIDRIGILGAEAQRLADHVVASWRRVRRQAPRAQAARPRPQLRAVHQSFNGV